MDLVKEMVDRGYIVPAIQSRLRPFVSSLLTAVENHPDVVESWLRQLDDPEHVDGAQRVYSVQQVGSLVNGLYNLVFEGTLPLSSNAQAVEGESLRPLPIDLAIKVF